MPIEFRCSSCNRILRTPDESAGKKARCPECGAIVDIPAATPAGSAPQAAPGPLDPSPFPSGAPSTPPEPSGPTFGATPSHGEAFGGARPLPGPNPFGDSSSEAAASGTAPFSPRPGDGLGSKFVNPYAAPGFREELPTAVNKPYDLSRRIVDMGDLLTTTWTILKRQFGMAIVLGLVAMGVNFGLSMVGNIAVQLGAASQELSIIIVTQVFSNVLNFLGQTWIQLGLACTALRWARTDQIQVGDLFAVGPFYLRGLGMGFLTNLIVGLVLFVCAIPVLATIPLQNEVASVVAGIAGLLVFLPIAIWIFLSLYLSQFFIIDRNLSIVESMKQSNAYMADNRGPIFLTGVVAGVCSLLAIVFTCCIATLVVVPFMGLMSAVAYLKITGQPLYNPPAVAPSPAYGAPPVA